MKKGTVKYSIISVISLVCLVAICMFMYSTRIDESTDILMLSQYVIEGMTSWYIMLFSVIAMLVFIRWQFKEPALKSVGMTLLVKAFTTLISLVGIHITGLIVELLLAFLPIGSFHLISWIVNLVLATMMYALLDGWALKMFFKKSFKKNYWRLCLYNAIVVVVCLLSNLSTWVNHIYL